MKKVFLSFLLFAYFFNSAQTAAKENALITIRGNVGIPRTVSSMMFRTAFSGLYEASLGVNLRLTKNFFAGIGYQNSHFQNDKDIFRFEYYNVSLPYNTRLIHHSAFLKFGVDKFFSDHNYMSYSLNSGLMYSSYMNVNADTSVANRPYGIQYFIAPYVQPEMSVNFIIDEKESLALSIILSYTTEFSRFDPKGPRFNQFEQISIKRNDYFMSWFTIGFGFHVLIKGKSKAG